MYAALTRCHVWYCSAGCMGLDDCVYLLAQAHTPTAATAVSTTRCKSCLKPSTIFFNSGGSVADTSTVACQNGGGDAKMLSASSQR